MKKTLTTVAAMVALGTSPLIASAAVDTDNTTINANIGAAISMTTSATVALTVTPTGVGAASSNSDTVTVSTSNSTGYQLSFSNTDTTTSLAGPNANTIVAHSGTYAAPTTLGNNSWGYRIDDGTSAFGNGPTSAQTNQANLSGSWSGVPSSASPQTLKTTGGVASSDVTTVWYGVKVDTTKPSGTYTDNVTYTAVTNP